MAKEETKKKKTTSTKSSAKKTTTKKSTTKSTTPKSSVKKSTKSTKKTPVLVQEENNYGRMVIAALLIIVAIVCGYFGVQYKKGNFKAGSHYSMTLDEKKFKKAFEDLNGKNSENGITYKTVSIDEDNNVTYITLDEAKDKLDNGTGLIFFGYASSPWTRNVAPILINAMNGSNLEDIYFVDLKAEDGTDLRDEYIINQKGKAELKTKASDSYYSVLLALASGLNDYTIDGDNGKTVNAGEKRLTAPTIATVKDGEVLDIYTTNYEGHATEDGALLVLSKDEEESIGNKLTEMISDLLGDDCSTNEDEKGC